MESLWHKPSGPGGPLKGNVPLSKTPGTLHQSGTLCPFRNVKDQQICMSEPLVSSRKRQQGPRLEWRSWFLERLQGCLELLITLFGKWGENVSWGSGERTSHGAGKHPGGLSSSCGPLSLLPLMACTGTSPPIPGPRHHRHVCRGVKFDGNMQPTQLLLEPQNRAGPSGYRRDKAI